MQSIQAQEISQEFVPIPPIQIDSSFILGQPELVLENQFHDFGLVTKGERPRHTFEVYNRGTAPMIIDMVSACECTEVDWTRSLIYPGEKGHILAEYDSSEKIGEQEVTLDIIAYKMLPGQESPSEEEVLLSQARFRAFVKTAGVQN
jgi:hypothetical protein